LVEESSSSDGEDFNDGKAFDSSEKDSDDSDVEVLEVTYD